MSLHRKWPILPYQASRHREAAIALYRELLRGCQQLASVDRGRREQMQHVVRHRFKDHRYETSMRWLGLRFAAGYQAIDAIDAARSGDETKTHYLLDLLERTPARTKQPPAPANAYPKEIREALRKMENRKRREAAAIPVVKRSIFDRPLPREALTGRRRVPILFSADSVPVLRFKKPQPKSLSDYLNQRQKKKRKMVLQRDMLVQAEQLAYFEDEWDRHVSAISTDKKGRRKGDSQWVSAVKDALQHNQKWVHDWKRKDTDMAARMQAIVDQEQALFEQEKAEDTRNGHIHGHSKGGKHGSDRPLSASSNP